MHHVERLAIAALVHDLAGLAQPAGYQIPPAIAALARLDDPVLQTMLDLAETYAGSDSDQQPLAQAALRSIFSRIALEEDTQPQPTYHTLAPLPAASQPQDSLFPMREVDPSRRNAYIGAMLDPLAQLAATVDLDRFDHTYPHLLAWLQRYGCCLSAHRDDVSLYDHARLTSAIAACLARYHAGDLSVDAVQGMAESEPFCLLVGDLSGIQRYIFDIASIGPGGVARRLRARSFYLGALAEALGHLAADRFGMPLGNVIMASGGKFYVLVANDGTMDEQVAQLRTDVDTWLYEQFNGEVAINLAHICFAGARFQAGFGEEVTRLNLALSREKRRRSRAVLAGPDGWNEATFVINRHFEGAGACISCAKFPIVTPDNLCAKCARDVALGRQLPKARYVAYYRPGARGSDITVALDWSVRLLERHELHDAGEPYLVAKLNHPEIGELAALPGTFRYLANYVPSDQGVGLSFEAIAARAEGRPLLGFVKADVDHLGMLFAQGLRRDEGGNDTAAHIAALSRELDLFFSGWLQHMLSTTYPNFYTIFSGGDDLFLVGPWDQAAQLAMRVREQFGRFAGDNPDITLSAGVVFTKERYPISRAAEDAERALEHSKERVWQDTGGHKRTRDQITVLGDTFQWRAAPAIFAEIAMLKARTQHLTSAFLYALVEYSQLYRLWKEHEQVEGLRYKAWFAYNIARNLRKGDAELYRWADTLLQSLHSAQDNATMRHLGLIATYLLFARRKSAE